MAGCAICPAARIAPVVFAATVIIDRRQSLLAGVFAHRASARRTSVPGRGFVLRPGYSPRKSMSGRLFAWF